METKDLILVRGVSGSGKTSFAHVVSLLDDIVLAADDYFYDEDGNYNFDGSKLKEAHADCQFRTEKLMKENEALIFVANTFTREWEMKAYYELAEKYGYRVFSVIVENRHGGENEHGVPDEAVQAMRDRFEIKL
jgi:predicted kinase